MSYHHLFYLLNLTINLQLIIKHVSHHLQEELNHAAILEPFKQKPIDLHVSPFTSINKADSQWRLTIVVLRWSPNVNSDICVDSKFTLNSPQVDDIVTKVLQLEPGSLIYMTDISCAFCQSKVAPQDIDLFGLKLGDYYINQLVPFGFRDLISKERILIVFNLLLLYQIFILFSFYVNKAKRCLVP